MVKFVNPYTFLSFPDEVVREPVHGHDGSAPEIGDLYTGSFTVEWELKSPLLLPEKAKEEGWLEELDNGRGIVSVPGSSVKGAMRSLHEAAFFGCLSVVDLDYTPVYREGMVAGGKKEEGCWRIGVVAEVDKDGRPVKILPAKGEKIWVSAEKLKELYKGKTPRTGDVIELKDSLIVAQKQGGRDGSYRKEKRSTTPRRREITSKELGAEFLKQGDGNLKELSDKAFVIIISSQGARANKKPWYWAAQKLEADVLGLEVEKDVWELFKTKVAGSEDMREFGGDCASHVEVRKKGKLIGTRLVQNGKLRKGDAIWVKVENKASEQRITELSYSAIWRRSAQKEDSKDSSVLRLRDLLEKHLYPCDPADNETGMCLTCSLFGSISPETQKEEESGSDNVQSQDAKEAQGYAGHVRFSSLILPPDSERLGVQISAEEQIMPLASPKPANGQFYLDNDGNEKKTNTPKLGAALSQWDQQPNTEPKRKPAGRKFYWNHNPLRKKNDRYFYRAFQGANQQLTSKRRFVPIQDENGNQPVRLIGEISFDQISLAGLASLWYLLNLSSLFKTFGVKDDGTPVARLGGGKPLGFGAVSPKIIAFNLSSVKERYLQPEVKTIRKEDSSPDTVCWREEEFNKTCKEAVTERIVSDSNKEAVKDNLQRLYRVLNFDGPKPNKEYVVYPPSAGWDEFGTEKFHKTYEFFTRTGGKATRNGWGKWKPLPPLQPRNNQVIEW